MQLKKAGRREKMQIVFSVAVRRAVTQCGIDAGMRRLYKKNAMKSIVTISSACALAFAGMASAQDAPAPAPAPAAATPLRPAQPPQPPTPTPGQRLPDPFDHHGRLPHRTGSGRLLRPVLYRGKATQINDSGRIDIRRQSGKNHYKQQPES